MFFGLNHYLYILLLQYLKDQFLVFVLVGHLLHKYYLEERIDADKMAYNQYLHRHLKLIPGEFDPLLENNAPIAGLSIPFNRPILNMAEAIMAPELPAE